MSAKVWKNANAITAIFSFLPWIIYLVSYDVCQPLIKQFLDLMAQQPPCPRTRRYNVDAGAYGGF